MENSRRFKRGKSVKKSTFLAAALIVCAATHAMAQKLNAAGATFPYPIYSKWFSEFSNQHPGVEINYQSIGSGGGIRQLLDKTVDFGASDGPMTDEVREACAANSAIQYLGRQPMQRVLELMGEARCLVFPSVWYEGQPRTIIESLAKGTPVVASDLGAMREMVEPMRTGALFRAGDASAMADAVRQVWEQGQAMRQACRAAFEQRYGADANAHRLIEIYTAAVERRSGGATALAGGIDKNAASMLAG